MLQASFPAMGSRVEIALQGGREADLAFARDRIEELEARWSRFRPDSELSHLNAQGDAVVSPETSALVQLAIAAWELTDGLFDPTVYDAVRGAGYDRTFTRLREGRPVIDARPSDGCAGITVGRGRIRLPPRVRLDLGGIGKGRTADLVAADLLQRGAAGACVNVGGDVRVAGQAPEDAGTWAVAIEDPHHPEATKTVVALDDGGVASSTTLKRRWVTSTGEAHHLIDPRTGAPSASGVVASTVIAAEAAWAEVYAKCAVVAGAERGLELAGRHGLAALVTLADGTTIRTTSFERYEPWTAISGGTWPAPVG